LGLVSAGWLNLRGAGLAPSGLIRRLAMEAQLPQACGA